MKILAVDPGLHTGICLLDTEFTQVEVCNRVEEFTWQVEGEGWSSEVRMAERVLELAVEYEVGVLVMEDFIIYPEGSGKDNSARSGLSPVRITAMIDLAFAERFGYLYSEGSKGVSGGTRGPGGAGRKGYGPGRGLSSREVVEQGGVLRRMQMASLAKTTYTDERLKSYGGGSGDDGGCSGGIWKGLTAHERDAWRHALTFAKSAGMGA